MEACDDIAYSVIDAEYTVKKAYASFYDLMDFLQSSGGDETATRNVVEFSQAQNKKFKLEQLSSRELNDMSMQMFRVKAIHAMVQAATATFVDNIGQIMAGTIDPGFELIKSSPCAQLCKAVKEFARHHGFQHREVLRLELKGNRYIKSMMDTLWRAIQRGNDPNNPFERFVFGEISENYRRVYSAAGNSAYTRCQLLCDVLSGMTESYLVHKHAEFGSLGNAAA
jgi:dGTPase